MENKPHIVVLASGRGNGMRSSVPKALHPVLFRPMLHHALELAAAVPHRSLSVVAGEDEEAVLESGNGTPGVRCFRQPAGSGTVAGIRAVAPLLAAAPGTVLVLRADAVLLDADTFKKMLNRHSQGAARCTLGTTALETPRAHARVIRRIDGSVCDILEASECLGAEKSVNEVGVGLYCFESADLLLGLERLLHGNGHGERRLGEVVRLLARDGKRVLPFCFGDPLAALAVEDRETLSRVEAVLRERVNKRLMRRGVTLQDPASTWIDARCQLSPDVRIEAGCVLIDSTVQEGATVEAHCRIEGSSIGPGSRIRQGSCLEGSRIAARCSVGPYAHLRPGTRLETDVKVGNFVELKAATLGPGTKAAHLSYIGDAELGRDVNVGCGFITCNYDGGPVKHRTVIEDDVFIGSDCQAVAPVRVARGSYVAAGTTLTDDVPPESLAISRGRQTTKAGYAAKYRRKAGASSDLTKI